jgi:hypothetical protein
MQLRGLHKTPKPGMKIIDRIKSDPRTQSFWDEGDDGLWIRLKDGYCRPGGDVHFIFERSIRDAWRALKTVEKCSCADCAGTIEVANEA